MSQEPNYEVFAIRYATVDRRAKDNFLVWRAEDRPMRLDFYFWAIRSAERCIVVDTGFSEASSQKRKRPFLHHPVAALKALGIDAADVTDVILTHLHFDHAGNLDAFPAATFHLQEAEMAYATGRHMTQPFFREHYAVEDVEAALRLVYAGRMRFYDGDADFAPGISLHRIDGHTIGLQAVRVNTARGRLVIASDAAHYYANLDGDNPFPSMVSVAGKIDGYRRMRGLASAPDLVIPSHDPRIADEFPTVPGLPDIACLHEAPRRLTPA